MDRDIKVHKPGDGHYFIDPCAGTPIMINKVHVMGFCSMEFQYNFFMRNYKLCPDYGEDGSSLYSITLLKTEKRKKGNKEKSKNRKVYYSSYVCDGIQLNVLVNLTIKVTRPPTVPGWTLNTGRLA